MCMWICMYLPVSQKSLKMENHLLFMLGEISTLDPRSKIISPPQSTAFATSPQTCVSRHRSPVSRTMFLDVRNQDDIFLWCPWSFLHSNLVTAWWSSHLYLLYVNITLWLGEEWNGLWYEQREGLWWWSDIYIGEERFVVFCGLRA
jgi:hypothetical protein